MAKRDNKILIPDEIIINKIYLLRGQKVMLDRDLAELYHVQTRDLNKAVSRNMKRFPEDFMFKLTKEEFDILMFQFGTSRWGGTRKLPNAFTEQGVAMLSSVLKSETAIEVNIHIIRIFTKMRELLVTHKDILLKLEQMENQLTLHNKELQYVFDVLKQLLQPSNEPRKKIGFKL